MAANIEFGIDAFGDVTAGTDGYLLPHAQVIRNVVDQAMLADTLGIDFFRIGEHPRADCAVSSPESCSRRLWDVPVRSTSDLR